MVIIWCCFAVIFIIIIAGESKKKFAVFAANFYLLKRWLFREISFAFIFFLLIDFQGDFIELLKIN